GLFLLVEEEAEFVGQLGVLGQRGVLGDDALGSPAGGVDHLAVAAQRRQLQVAAALLAVSEDRALAADLEAGLGQPEAVVVPPQRPGPAVALGPLLLVARSAACSGDQVAVRRG